MNVFGKGLVDLFKDPFFHLLCKELGILLFLIHLIGIGGGVNLRKDSLDPPYVSKVPARVFDLIDGSLPPAQLLRSGFFQVSGSCGYSSGGKSGKAIQKIGVFLLPGPDHIIFSAHKETFYLFERLRFDDLIHIRKEDDVLLPALLEAAQDLIALECLPFPGIVCIDALLQSNMNDLIFKLFKQMAVFFKIERLELPLKIFNRLHDHELIDALIELI